MSPKRGSLAGLISDPGHAPPMPAPPRREEGQAAAAARAITSEARSSEVPSSEAERGRQTRRGSRRDRQPAEPSQFRSSEVPTPDLPTPDVPKYLRLDRKDTLLWPGQMAELTVLQRMLNKRRQGAGERITENTLIRIGVSLVLSRAAELRGVTEEELRRSLGL